uniref:insulin receptor substrate 2-B-like n=1 Tax=Monopterus albus TaxID=43700 RepID=UPI0009B32F71|nr:insulin receptor substrate 2-B-like [Monopterus albus]
MTLNLSRGDRMQTSPTAMLQHLCVIEGHYGHAPSAASSSISPPLPPSSPSRMLTQQLEPKVVRADPQGRRRHSSETFSSTSSSNSTPSGGGPSSSTPLPTLSNPTATNGSYLTEGHASRWASSASFDSVWMSVEGVDDSPAHHAPARAMEMITASGTSASSSSSSGAGASRVCRNMSVGYQNGLNYIALELREDGSDTGAMTSGAVSSNGSLAVAGTVPLPENGAYASIDFTRSDGVATTNND